MYPHTLSTRSTQLPRRPHVALVGSLLGLCLLLWMACDGKPQEPGPSDAATADGQVSEGATETSASDTSGVDTTQNVAKPTYFGQVKGIIEARCLGCHKAGGMGPFALETYEQLVQYKAAVKDSVEQRRMPPWQATAQCNEYSNDFSLTASERTHILRWIEQGHARGDEASYKAPTHRSNTSLARIDMRLKMPEAYTSPAKRTDDYRCFVIDWPSKQRTYVTGFQVTPGNPRTVHHLIIYLADPATAASYAKIDKDEPGPGYNCFGGPGGNDYPRLLGAWAPGTPATEYPKGTGLLVEPGSKIILQIHYNIANSLKEGVKPDQSTIELSTTNQVEQYAEIAPLVNPFWMRGQTMKLPKNKADIEHKFSLDMAGLVGGKIITIHGAALHMHLLGKKGSISITRSASSDAPQCLLEIPKWDFGWQSVFLLKRQVKLYPGDKLNLSCHFDNSADNQPVVDGQKQAAQDVYWGGKSNDEMCLGFLYITCTDLDGNPETKCFDF